MIHSFVVLVTPQLTQILTPLSLFSLLTVQQQNVSHFVIGFLLLDFERFYQVLGQTLVRL